MCSLLLIATVKNLLIKMFGRKAAEVAVEERCIMTRGNSYSSSSINIVFIGGWRDSSPSRFYPLSGRGMF